MLFLAVSATMLKLVAEVVELVAAVCARRVKGAERSAARTTDFVISPIPLQNARFGLLSRDARQDFNLTRAHY